MHKLGMLILTLRLHSKTKLLCFVHCIQIHIQWMIDRWEGKNKKKEKEGGSHSLVLDMDQISTFSPSPEFHLQ